MDFPVTRAILKQFPDWVEAFAATLPTPERARLPGGDFRWEYSVKDGKALLVTKAVRIASGLQAAMHLADVRYTAEVMVILRTVSDFASEIGFVSEGFIRGSFTQEQNQFIDQHFASVPSDPDELAAREREYYIGRKAMAKPLRRLAEQSGMPADQIANITAFLNKGYDGFVHGASYSAMELFTGGSFTFMMSGNKSDRAACIAKIAVAGKLKEGLNALSFMALVWKRQDIDEELRSAFMRLDASKEDTRIACASILA